MTWRVLHHAGVATITAQTLSSFEQIRGVSGLQMGLNRRAKRHAFTVEMLEELATA